MMTGARQHALIVTGAAVGLAYALLAYFGFLLRGENRIATATFLGLVPIALAFVPFTLFDDEDQVVCFRSAVFIPWLSLLGLFLVLLALGAEDVLCVLVLAAPLVLVVTLTVWIVVGLGIWRAKKRRRRALGLLVMLLPFGAVEVETRALTRAETFTVERAIDVRAGREAVWARIVEVAPIAHEEHRPGLLNRLGVPRPLFATVDRHAAGGRRIGVFEEGIRFIEDMVVFDRPSRLRLDVKIDPGSPAPSRTLAHAFDTGILELAAVEYRLEPRGPGTTRLTLACRYVLRTSINAYGRLWVDAVLGDFEERLLPVIRRRAESSAPRAPRPAVAAAATAVVGGTADLAGPAEANPRGSGSGQPPRGPHQRVLGLVVVSHGAHELAPGARQVFLRRDVLEHARDAEVAALPAQREGLLGQRERRSARAHAIGGRPQPRVALHDLPRDAQAHALGLLLGAGAPRARLLGPALVEEAAGAEPPLEVGEIIAARAEHGVGAVATAPEAPDEDLRAELRHQGGAGGLPLAGLRRRHARPALVEIRVLRERGAHEPLERDRLVDELEGHDVARGRGEVRAGLEAQRLGEPRGRDGALLEGLPRGERALLGAHARP
jgi:hypothetical protein